MDELFQQAADTIQAANEITIISHADADGICATALLEEHLDQLHKQFSTIFLQQVSTVGLAHLARKTSGLVLFVDMGSSHLEAITRHFPDAVIVDHHKPEGSTKQLLVNPWTAALDGTKDACAASLAWKIAAVHGKPAATTALIGAQADNQEPFRTYNKEVLDAAVKKGNVTPREGARLYGISTKPLVPLLAFSYDLAIEGVTKNTAGAKKFLQELGISTEGSFSDLTEEEQQQLEAALIEKSTHPEPKITHYHMPHGEGPLKDTREAATLLNACGRMGQPELAVQLLRGFATIEQCQKVQRQYKTAVKEAHQTYKEMDLTEGKDLLIINAKEFLLPSIAGTLCSVLTRGREVPSDTVVVCLARNQDGTNTTKVSSRTLSTRKDLASWLRKAAASVGGEGGGHSMAAGAVIPTEQEEAFVKALL
ncbi:MAG: DHH family phosphoesterase [Candidatus Woesearchaeota archaeon]|nr:DHH family phosphoesterase [Candidatus Woesearchaeota archaeon]